MTVPATWRSRSGCEGFRHADIDRRVDAVLRLVRLSGLEHRSRQLSGGQQQRVALARAMVFEPAVLLLDEPLAALDRKLREEVRAELRRLQRAVGVTTVLVTHDQDEALSVSDSIVVLNDGEVEQTGSPHETYLHPANRFVADFLGTAELFEGELRPRAEGLASARRRADAAGRARRRAKVAARGRCSGRSGSSCGTPRTAMECRQPERASTTGSWSAISFAWRTAARSSRSPPTWFRVSAR